MIFDTNVFEQERCIFQGGFRPHTGPGRALMGPYGPNKSKKHGKNPFNRALQRAYHPALIDSLTFLLL